MSCGDAAAEARRFLAEHPGLESLDVLIADTAGVLRAKRIRADSIDRFTTEGIRLPGSMFSMDSTGTIVEGTGIVAEEGERDRFLRLVPGTLAPIPWAEAADGQVRRGQALATMVEADGSHFFADPRHVLGSVLDRFSEPGLRPVVAVELEFHLVEAELDAGGMARPAKLALGGHTQVYAADRLEAASAFIEDVRGACSVQGVVADSAVAESGPGHYEINLRHHADALLAADQALLFKRVVRAIARQHGLRASFMAKPFDSLSGSGLHLHASLLDAAGANLFAATPDAPDSCSEALGHAVAGILATMPEAMAIFAPNANSYRRYRPGAFVPMTANWGFNNRTTALRIPPGAAEATRIEHRVAGADANIHLVAAAILAGLHHGIVGCATPPAPIDGDASARSGPSLPSSWPAALDAFESARVLPEYLGLRYSQLYLAVKRAERTRFESVVTPLDHDWYLTTF